MKPTDVYLEINEAGQCMAHVPALPGCVVREWNREAALARLPDAIREYVSWLRQHGEDLEEIAEPIRPHVVGVSSDIGPFDPGDQSDLFPWEKEALGRDEMVRLFRLASYNRADLLALVRPLSRSVRTWEPGPDKMSINRILRHIGNAEQWYVSRLVAPEDLPGQWADDEDMPVLRYLKMTRETAEASLNQLADEELGRVFFPTEFTEKPGEPWTARKVMRRFLEHEREHIGHIRQNLTFWRQRLLARIAGERASLLWQLRGANHETLCHAPVSDGWTAKDLLAHVAAWDAVHARRMEMIEDGRIDEIQPVGGEAAMDQQNAEFTERNKALPLDQVVALCLQERAQYLERLGRLSDADLHRQIKMPWGWHTRLRVWAKWRYQHDATHARDLSRWRGRLSLNRERQVGPRSVLLANFSAARQEFLALVALVPEPDRAEKPLRDDWTLKDMIGHLADWEQAGVEWLRRLLAGQAPLIDALEADVEEFNRVKVPLRKPQPWEQVWGDFLTARHQLGELVHRVTDEDLAQTFQSPWGSEPTLYRWIEIWPEHDREHAIELRKALGLPGSFRR